MSKPTILLIESNEASRKRLSAALEDEDYIVIEASTGQSALDKAQFHKIDLVLQDLALPDMDGLELNQQLRALPGGADLPIFALSGFLSCMDDTMTSEVRFTDFLVKPLEITHLIEVVKTYLPNSAAKEERVGKGRYVLLVDDSPTQLKLMRLHLTNAGFKVLTATNGEEALNQVLIKQPDAVVSDVLMPQMDGFELCLNIRSNPKFAHLPVILISAHYLEEADYLLAKKVAASTYLKRTPDAKELIETLIDCLNTKLPIKTIEPIGLVKEKHMHRLIRQLERQLVANSGLALRSALQASQLALLGGMAEALTNSSDIEVTLKEMLTTCLDAAGISLGVLYLLDEKQKLCLKVMVNFRASEEVLLRNFFDLPELFTQTLMTQRTLQIPSSEEMYPAEQELLNKVAARSAIITPIIAGSKCLGVLFLGSQTNNITGSSSLLFTNTLGAQIGQAIALAGAFERIQISEQKLEKRVQDRTKQLEAINKELESFSFSVSHDLRAPLRSIEGFSRLLEEKYKEQLDNQARDYLQRIYSGVDRLSQLIDDVLRLSQVAGSEIELDDEVNLTNLARIIRKELEENDPNRKVEWVIQEDLRIMGDRRLLQIMLANLLKNAWKFTAKAVHAKIELGSKEESNQTVYFVRDNGAGFDMKYKDKLFSAFQRLHTTKDFPGTGIGLATVARIIHRHNGKVWAEAEVGKGAIFYFVL